MCIHVWVYTQRSVLSCCVNSGRTPTVSSGKFIGRDRYLLMEVAAEKQKENDSRGRSGGWCWGGEFNSHYIYGGIFLYRSVLYIGRKEMRGMDPRCTQLYSPHLWWNTYPGDYGAAAICITPLRHLSLPLSPPLSLSLSLTQRHLCRKSYKDVTPAESRITFSFTFEGDVIRCTAVKNVHWYRK